MVCILYIMKFFKEELQQTLVKFEFGIVIILWTDIGHKHFGIMILQILFEVREKSS